MEFRNVLLCLVFTLAFFQLPLHAYSVGTSGMYAPAVLENQDVGVLTYIQLSVTTGTGNVSVNGNNSSLVGITTLASADSAALYASSYLGLNESNYNFTYNISDSSGYLNVSGPSGGLVLTMLAISALSNKPVMHNFTATGTIQSDGQVGPVGGVMDKISAASASHMNFIMVPFSLNGSLEQLTYFIAQGKYNIPVVPVHNVSEALGYAYGKTFPTYLQYYLQKYNYSMPVVNSTCTECNIPAFSNLTSMTLNITSGEILGVPRNYSKFSSSGLSTLSSIAQVADKGYLYSAANLAFSEFIRAYTLSNIGNFTPANAFIALSEVSNVCSSLTPPPMTKNNYEFVIGGEIRQTWANVTLANAFTILNQSQTTDDIVYAINTAGSAYGWCKATQSLYASAALIGGNETMQSKTLANESFAKLQQIKQFGGALYVNAAQQDYNKGQYAASLYDSLYALTFYNTSAFSTTNVSTSEINTLIANASVGNWPYQFGLNAKFYESQGLLATNASDKLSFLQSSLQMAQFANSIGAANKFISSNLQTPQVEVPQATINDIYQQLNDIYGALLVILIILVGILATLIVMLVNQKHPKKKGR